jgi:hypothetical protein
MIKLTAFILFRFVLFHFILFFLFPFYLFFFSLPVSLFLVKLPMMLNDWFYELLKEKRKIFNANIYLLPFY